MTRKTFGQLIIGEVFKIGLLTLKRVLTKEGPDGKYNAISIEHPDNTYYIPKTQVVNAVID